LATSLASMMGVTLIAEGEMRKSRIGVTNESLAIYGGDGDL